MRHWRMSCFLDDGDGLHDLPSADQRRQVSSSDIHADWSVMVGFAPRPSSLDAVERTAEAASTGFSDCPMAKSASSDAK